MIPRYSHEEMAAVWTDQAKFAAWRTVELAVLEAREALGQVPKGTANHCRGLTGVDDCSVSLINRRDSWVKHDLNAFLDVMRLQLIHDKDLQVFLEEQMRLEIRDGHEHGESLDRDTVFHGVIDRVLTAVSGRPIARYFHDGMTSYDTEEPATALLLRRACGIIQQDLDDLCRILAQRAMGHRGVIMMGRTHGQHAQPITFGVKCLNWLDMADRARDRLRAAEREASVMKLSGAVGMYSMLEPEVECRVAEILDLDFAPVATQIVALDRRARLVATLSEIATVAEKISRDLWLLAQTEIGEIREPFSARQKGSSAMPHKKNPIALEQCFGLPRLIRAYAQALAENVATAGERDISHSSVERIAVPDAFGLTDHLLRRLTDVVERMEVFPKRMMENLECSHGTYASQRVESFLKHHGVSPEKAYRLVQEACFLAVERRVHLMSALSDLVAKSGEAVDLSLLSPEEPEEFSSVMECFVPAQWVAAEEAIYRRNATLIAGAGVEVPPEWLLTDREG